MSGTMASGPQDAVIGSGATTPTPAAGRGTLVLLSVLGALGSAGVIGSAMLPQAWSLPFALCGFAVAALSIVAVVVVLLRA
jgi:hypothetical protein